MDEVSTPATSSKISELTSFMKDFAIGLVQQIQASSPPRPCGICAYVGHPTDQCPTLQEDNQQVNAIGGYNNQPRHDPYSNTYNPGWRDHPNLNYARTNNHTYQRNQAQPAPPSSNQHLEKMMETLASSMQSIQQQIEQMTTSLNANMLRREEEFQDDETDDESS